MIDEEKLKAAKAKLDAIRAKALGLPPPVADVDPEQATLREFKAALPLIVEDRKGVSVQMVNMYHLHGALGIATRPRQWLLRAIEKYGFVEDEDYIKVEIDPSTPEGRAQLKSGATHNYSLTSDMAKELCMVQASDIGRQVRKYFLVAERVAKKHAAKEFAAALGKANEEAHAAQQNFLRVDAPFTAWALKAGFKSGTNAIIAYENKEATTRARRAATAATAAATIMWEQSTTARRHALAGHLPQALAALNEIEQTFGSYTDMARGTPPWSDEQ